MKIKSDHFVSNEEVLKRSGFENIELKLIGNRLRWLGHICRMDDNRTAKALLHSELFHGSQPVGRPYLSFKDTCKNALKCGHILDVWKTVVDNRQECKRPIRTVCESHDIKRIKEDESHTQRSRQKKSRL